MRSNRLEGRSNRLEGRSNRLEGRSNRLEGRGAVWLAAVLLALVASPAHAAEDPVAREVFSFADDRIAESSGLVDLGGLMVTVNDSGDAARVFVVDPADGQTVGVRTWAGEAVDVEALAPAGDRAVWVGDIGDNQASRPYVTVTRVGVGRGDEASGGPSYRLAYPDGPADAESLFVADGRLHVVTKGMAGGVVLRAPERLREGRDNPMEVVGSVRELATDAALTLDGRHLMVRGYGAVSVVTFPGLEPVGRFALPEQPQGEAISVGPEGRVRISSEQVGTPVLEVEVPAAFRKAMAPAPSASPDADGESARAPKAADGSEGESPWSEPLPWAVSAVGATVVLGLALLARSRRRRSR